jgi:dienelactone hydrolase
VSRVVRLAAVALLAGLVAAPARATESHKLDVDVRGKTLTLYLYQPPAGAPAKGTIFMSSGDVGWVGLATTLADYLSDQGYVVAGVNVRQYLSTFTTGKDHVTVPQVPLDYRLFADALKSRGLLPSPVVLSGVSEGAALAVAAAAAPESRAWVHGVLTMGLPPSDELAFHWSDFTSWITKKPMNEPSFDPERIIGDIAPTPLFMIQSTKDEYVKEADYRRFEAAARDPKKLVLIDAANHRFTDKIPELKTQVLAGLAWINAGGK